MILSDSSRLYATPEALRRALTDRLRQRALERGEDVRRLHRMVAFDRVLARLFAEGGKAPWILKGGCALELRYRTGARATVDLDLSVPGGDAFGSNQAEALDRLLERLRAVVAVDLSDGFDIRIAAASKFFDAPPRGGARFPVEVRLAGRRFAGFHLDVGIGDVVTGEVDYITGEEFLGFAGIPASRIAVIPVAQQFAEKVHAYTLPRVRAANTRVKDLVDLALLLEQGRPSPEAARQALEATFARRATHAIPLAPPAPPGEWKETFEELAGTASLASETLAEAHRLLAGFWGRMGFIRS